MKLDLVVCGSAGQGVLTLANVLLGAAVSEGFTGHSSAQSGIAQLEGPVIAHVRLGTPAAPSLKIPYGKAHAILALDRLEALRARPYLAPGRPLLVNENGQPPMPARLGNGRYPERAEVEESFEGHEVHWIPAGDLIKNLGNQKLVGAVMLGVLSALTPTLDRDHLVMSLRRAFPVRADAEVEAFFLGHGFITGREE